MILKSTYSYNPTGVHWEAFDLSASQVRTATNSTDFQVWLALGYFQNAFPNGTEAICQVFTGEPTIQDDIAVWAVPEDCAERQRAAIQQELLDQVPNYTSSQIAADDGLMDETHLAQARRTAAFVALKNTPDEALGSFSTDLFDYLPSNADYAEILALRETANLQQNTAMTNAGSLALYSADTVETMNTRIAYNTNVATTGEGVPSTPAPTTEGYGDQRADLTLLDETLVHALVEEISDVVNTVTYYMPRVTLPFIPDGVGPSKVYMLMYDNDGSFGGVYRTWAPFVMQGDGSWQTEFHVSRAKTTSGLWRVCVNNGHESEPYRITRKVYLGEGGYNDNLVVKWD